jgi:hypothetical protein
VWELKEDPAKGIQDAVVLEKRVRLLNYRTEFLYRVRVLNEAGRASCQLTLPSYAYEVEGRTVYRDGRTVAFNGTKDFTVVKTRATSGFEDKVTQVIPPGVTADCVVELRYAWEGDTPEGPLPRRLAMAAPAFDAPYHTLLSALELPSNYVWSCQLFPAPDRTPVTTKKGIWTYYTFTDLAAREDAPYSLETVENHPEFVVFSQPERLRPLVSRPDDYWAATVDLVYRETYGRQVRLGSSFRALTAALLQAVPAGTGPREAAGLLLQGLQQRVRNTQAPTWEEVANRPRNLAKKDFKATDLEAMADNLETNPEGMCIAFFHVLKAAGLKPHLGLVPDRGRRVFNYQYSNLYQLVRETELIGVEVPGVGVHWFDPTLRHAQPGQVHPAKQGMPGLDVDPVKWTVAQMRVPMQRAAANRRAFEYWIGLGEEEDAFRMTATFEGYPEYLERHQFMAFEGKEQARLLKEQLEDHLKGATLTRTEVLDAQNPLKGVRWEVQGSLESRGGRRRQVRPFPAMPDALWIPEHFRPTRTSRIILPYARTQTAVSHITVPKGFQAGPWPPVRRSTSFGQVSLTTTAQPRGEDTEITVSLTVEVTRVFANAASYAEFKAFLAMVQEVSQTVLHLEKAQ